MTTRVTVGAKSEQRPTRWVYTFRYIELALKKGWHCFLLQSLKLSSLRPESHDESWSLQGKLQRPLTKCGSDQPLQLYL